MKGCLSSSLIMHPQLPDLLILHIQRTQWRSAGEAYKRDDPIHFSKILNMAPYTYVNALNIPQPEPALALLARVQSFATGRTGTTPESLVPSSKSVELPSEDSNADAVSKTPTKSETRRQSKSKTLKKKITERFNKKSSNAARVEQRDDKISANAVKSDTVANYPECTLFVNGNSISCDPFPGGTTPVAPRILAPDTLKGTVYNALDQFSETASDKSSGTECDTVLSKMSRTVTALDTFTTTVSNSRDVTIVDASVEIAFGASDETTPDASVETASGSTVETASGASVETAPDVSVKTALDASVETASGESVEIVSVAYVETAQKASAEIETAPGTSVELTTHTFDECYVSGKTAHVASVETAPLDRSVETVALDRAIETVPLDRSFETVPLDRTVETVPLDRSVETVPLVRSVEIVPLVRSVETVPLVRSVETAPVIKDRAHNTFHHKTTSPETSTLNDSIHFTENNVIPIYETSRKTEINPGIFPDNFNKLSEAGSCEIGNDKSCNNQSDIIFVRSLSCNESMSADSFSCDNKPVESSTPEAASSSDAFDGALTSTTPHCSAEPDQCPTDRSERSTSSPHPPVVDTGSGSNDSCSSDVTFSESSFIEEPFAADEGETSSPVQPQCSEAAMKALVSSRRLVYLCVNKLFKCLI